MNMQKRCFQHDLADLIARKANDVALIALREVDSVQVTYAGMGRIIGRIWRLFQDRGLEPRDSVMVMMPNCIEGLCLFFASLSGGLQYVPISCAASADEVRDCVKRVSPKLCFINRLVKPEIVAAVVGSSIPMIEVGNDNTYDWLPAQEGTAPGRSGKILLGTSGTTGDPKMMIIDGDTLWSCGYAFMGYHAMQESGARFWNYLPVSYLGGLFNLGLIPLAAQGSIVVDEAFSGKTYLTYWQTVQRFQIDTLWLVPTIVRGLVSLGKVAKRRAVDIDRVVQRFFLGTAPIELSLKRDFENMFGRPVMENYALSETLFITSEDKESHASRSEGSVGAPLPYADISFRTLDESQESGPAREILVKTPFLCEGYVGMGGREELSLVDGWFPTGDLGYRNVSGQLVVAGRLRDIVKKGGYFIALREIEILAAGLPDVEEAAAVGIKHYFYGESYVLHVVPRSGPDPGCRERILRELHVRLAQYRWPEDVILCDQLPKTSSGKVRKGQLGAGTKEGT